MSYVSDFAFCAGAKNSLKALKVASNTLLFAEHEMRLAKQRLAAAA